MNTNIPSSGVITSTEQDTLLFAPPPIAWDIAISLSTIPPIVVLRSEVSRWQKAIPTPISILWWRFSVTLPMLSTHKMIANDWFREIGNYLNQSITTFLPRVGRSRSSAIDCGSLAIGSLTVTNEAPLLRTFSWPSGTRVQSFRNSVRDLYLGCVITGRPGIINGVGWWETFKATHIFPLAYGTRWNDLNTVIRSPF